MKLSSLIETITGWVRSRFTGTVVVRFHEGGVRTVKEVEKAELSVYIAKKGDIN